MLRPPNFGSKATLLHCMVTQYTTTPVETMRPYRLALGLALAGAPATALAQSATPLRSEVEALHSAMLAAFRRDPAAVADFYTDDARILGGGGRYIGREQVNQYWKQSPAGAEWQLEIMEVGGDKDTPWVRGISTLQSQSGRRLVTEYVGLLRRQPDNTLKFYVDIYTSTSPMRAPGGAP